MDKQMSLSGLSDELSQVRTKKKEFLSQIERIVPWGEWIELIRPHYYRGNGFVTKSTDGSRRVNTQTIVPARKSSAAKGRNPPYGPR